MKKQVNFTEYIDHWLGRCGIVEVNINPDDKMSTSNELYYHRYTTIKEFTRGAIAFHLAMNLLEIQGDHNLECYRASPVKVEKINLWNKKEDK